METNLSEVAALNVNVDVIDQGQDVSITVKPVQEPEHLPTNGNANTPILGVVIPNQNAAVVPASKCVVIPSGNPETKFGKPDKTHKFSKEEYEQRKAFIAEAIIRRSGKFQEAGYPDDIHAALCKYVSANRGYDEKGRHQGDRLTYLLCKFAQYCNEARNFTVNIQDRLKENFDVLVTMMHDGALEAETFRVFKEQQKQRDAVAFIMGRMNALVHSYSEFRYMAEGVSYLLHTFPKALGFCEHVTVAEETPENAPVEKKREKKPKQHAPAGVKQGARPQPKGLNASSFDALNYANGELVVDPTNESASIVSETHHQE